MFTIVLCRISLGKMFLVSTTIENMFSTDIMFVCLQLCHLVSNCDVRVDINIEHVLYHNDEREQVLY